MAGTVTANVRLRGRRVLWLVTMAALAARACRLISDERVEAWVNWALARCQFETRVGRRGEWTPAGMVETRMRLTEREA